MRQDGIVLAITLCSSFYPTITFMTSDSSVKSHRDLGHECNAYCSRHIERHFGIVSLRMGLKSKRLAEFFWISCVLRQCGEVERRRAAGPLAAVILTLVNPRI